MPEGLIRARGVRREVTRIFERLIGGERAQEIVILRADRRTGIALGDLIPGRVRLLILELRGVASMIGDQHPLQAIKHQKPRPPLQLQGSAAP